MKKILSITLAVSAALSTSAIASVGGNGIFGDVAFINDKGTNTSAAVSQNDVNETVIGATHRMENGVFIGAEATYDWNSATSGHKATTVGAGYRFNISENFYIMPQASYTFRDHASDYSYSLEPFDSNKIDDGTNWNAGADYNVGDTWSVGFQSAYHLDNGVFFAARYTYEKSEDVLSVGSIVTGGISDSSMNPDTILFTDPQAGFDAKVGSHEMELTVGYKLDNVALLSASWKQTKFSDVSGYSNEYPIPEQYMVPAVNTTSTKFKGKSDDFEVRAAYLGFENAMPFVSFTRVGDYTIKSNAMPSNLVGSSEHVLEVGFSYNF
ncbi:MAG: porin family protein [Colwellia sp.]|nr:porin family protein [Colwellia sp.]